MKVGDLVRHVVHTGAMGIITEVCLGEVRVFWHDGDHSWTLSRRMEVINESR
jgi:hypothetical protein